MHTATQAHSGRPYHRYMLTNTYAEQLASVQADMSKPSGAMVTVAAMPNTVVMDMARRMLIMLLTDMKRLPLSRVNTTKHSTSVMTAAQSSRKRRKVLFCFVASGFGFNVACITECPPVIACPAVRRTLWCCPRRSA